MATPKFQWTTAATKYLIVEYENNEMLYNTKLEDYKNRNKRQEIYQRIANAVNTVADGCTAADVQKKINGLRCQYLAEKAKILKSMKSGSSTDSIYEPTAYWFPMLHFLDAAVTSDESMCNLEISLNEKYKEDYIQNIIQEGSSNEVDNGPTKALPNFQLANTNKGQTDDEVDIGQTQADFQPNSKKRKNDSEVNKNTGQTKTQTEFYVPNSKKTKKADSVDSLLLKATTTMNEMSLLATEKRRMIEKDDELDTFGKFIVSELRAIQQSSNNYTVRLVKRKIQNVIMDMWDTIDGGSLPAIVEIKIPNSYSNSCNSSIVTQSLDQLDPRALSSPASGDILTQTMHTANVDVE